MIDERQIEDDAFESTLERLNARAAEDGFDLSDVEAELTGIEEYGGLGWSSRRAVKSAELAGTITAYQAFIVRFKKKQP